MNPTQDVEVWRRLAYTPSSALVGEAPGRKRRFLVCVDYDEVSTKRAVAFTKDVLAKPGDVVVLVHVVPYAATVSATVSGGAAGTYLVEMPSAPRHDEMLEAAEDLLTKTADSALAGAQLTVELQVLVEHTHERIAKALNLHAEDTSASAVVVGSTGKAWWEEILLGSVSSALLHELKNCALVVVH